MLLGMTAVKLDSSVRIPHNGAKWWEGPTNLVYIKLTIAHAEWNMSSVAIRKVRKLLVRIAWMWVSFSGQRAWGSTKDCQYWGLVYLIIDVPWCGIRLQGHGNIQWVLYYGMIAEDLTQWLFSIWQHVYKFEVRYAFGMQRAKKVDWGLHLTSSRHWRFSQWMTWISCYLFIYYINNTSSTRCAVTSHSLYGFNHTDWQPQPQQWWWQKWMHAWMNTY